MGRSRIIRLPVGYPSAVQTVIEIVPAIELVALVGPRRLVLAGALAAEPDASVIVGPVEP